MCRVCSSLGEGGGGGGRKEKKEEERDTGKGKGHEEEKADGDETKKVSTRTKWRIDREGTNQDTHSRSIGARRPSSVGAVGRTYASSDLRIYRRVGPVLGS